jgi:hypothetical protein
MYENRYWFPPDPVPFSTGPGLQVRVFSSCSAVASSSITDHHNTSYHPEISFSTDFPNLDSAHGGEPSMLSQLDMSYDDRDSALQNSFNLMPYPDSTSTTSPSSTAASSTECPGTSSPPFPLSDNLEPEAVHSTSPQPRARKPLKDKAQIDLAPDQPPTTQGRPRARVFVACMQWCAPSPH